MKLRRPWNKRSANSPQKSGVEFGTAGRNGPGIGRRVEIVAAFLGILVAGFVLGPKIEGAFDTSGGVRLEIAEIAVSNPPAAYSSSGEAELRQEPMTEPTIAATVRNRGDNTVWIEEARISVIDGARLSTCISQGGGDVPQSKRYRITLPRFPGGKRRVFRRGLHVEVQAGHGVRPVLSFQMESPGVTNLYAIHVQLVADPGQRIVDVGRFVIGVPGPVSRSGEILPESDAALLSEATAPGEPLPTWCFRHNLDGMQRVITEPGKRSDYVAALAQMQVAPTWSNYADHRPAGVVVEELMLSDSPEALIYAIDAASRSGVRQYEVAVRKRAIALLLRRAGEELDHDPDGAIDDTERVLSLQPSPLAGRLLSRAKAGRRADEERAELELETLHGG